MNTAGSNEFLEKVVPIPLVDCRITVVFGQWAFLAVSIWSCSMWINITLLFQNLVSDLCKKHDIPQPDLDHSQVEYQGQDIKENSVSPNGCRVFNILLNQLESILFGVSSCWKSLETFSSQVWNNILWTCWSVAKVFKCLQGIYLKTCQLISVVFPLGSGFSASKAIRRRDLSRTDRGLWKVTE